MTKAFGNTPYSEQDRQLNQDPTHNLEKLSAEMKKNPAFKRMMQNEGIMNIADKLIVGKSSLTNAFIQAEDQVAAEQNPQLANAPQQVNPERAKGMSVEEKKNMWAGRGDIPLQ